MTGAAALNVPLERERREPVIPVIAPIPMQAYRDLFTLAETDWPTLDAPGVQVAWKVDARGVGVAAQMTVQDWEGRVLARRDFDGQWEVGGSVTWRPGR